METEQELLLDIRSGDRTAMRRLYDRYAAYTMAVALRYVPQREEVGDVLQDSFVKILHAVGDFQYRGEGSLKAWVARIVTNEALDYLKKKNRLKFTDDIPDTAEEEDDDAHAMDDIPPAVLNDMIGRLPPNYRIVLNLFVFGQHPHREIARQLGIKESSSASMLFRAKKMLAKMISEYTNRPDK